MPVERIRVSGLETPELATIMADGLLKRHYSGEEDGVLGNRVMDALASGFLRYTIDPGTKVLTLHASRRNCHRDA